MIPEELKYTKEHEWVRIDGEEVVFGITDHAQSELGDITFVELPENGTEIKKSESMSTVESVKAASDIYAPVSGKIVEVNQALESSPEVINASPYGDGWLCRVSVSDTSEIEGLMSAEDYGKFLEESN